MPSIINGHMEAREAAPHAGSAEQRTLPGLPCANIKSLDSARQARHDRSKHARTLFQDGRFVTLEQAAEEEDSAVPDGTA
jgi:hypothetical protein